MAGAQPKTKAEEYTEQVNSMWKSIVAGVPLNEFAWKRLFRDVEALVEVTGFGRYALRTLAVLWSFKEKEKEIDLCFSEYARRFGKDWDWYFSRAILGPSMGRLDMVTDFLGHGYPQDDPSMLIDVLDIVNQAGLFVTGMDLVQRLEQMGVEDIQSKCGIPIGHLLCAAKYIEQHGLDELDIALRIDCASKVVRRCFGGLTSFVLTANEYGISYEYGLKASLDKLVDIDLEIAEALCEQFDDPLSQHLTVCVIPADEVYQYGC